MPKTGKGDILKQTNECRGFAEEELKVVQEQGEKKKKGDKSEKNNLRWD